MLGPLAHLSSCRPLAFTPRQPPMPTFFQSFFWNWGGGGFPSPQKTQAPHPPGGGQRRVLWVSWVTFSSPGKVQFQEMATRWGTAPTNGDAWGSPGILESR